MQVGGSQSARNWHNRNKVAAKLTMKWKSKWKPLNQQLICNCIQKQRQRAFSRQITNENVKRA